MPYDKENDQVDAAKSLGLEKPLTLAVIVVLFSVLLIGCTSTAPAGTATSLATPVSTSLPTPTVTLPPGTIIYAIDAPGSMIKYVATGILNSQYPGTFKVTGQTIAFVPDGDSYRLQLDLTFDLTSATAIDSFMRNTLLNSLQVDQYPIAALSLTSNAFTSTQPDALQSAAFTLDGTYTLHGHQKTVELPVTITTGNGALQLNGSMEFNLSDYDVHVPAVLVNDPITFTAELTAKRQPGNSN